MNIILRDIKLWGYHGVSELEQRSGTEFKIDLTITLANEKSYKEIEDTVDYGEVYKILKTEFSKPEKLLETLAQRLGDMISMHFQGKVSIIQIEILKIGAPIEGLNGKVGVSFTRKIASVSP